MKTIFYKESERGTKDIGWLKSKFSFSFSSYQNPVAKGFGLLHTFNDDVVFPEGGFGIHPHVNMEIISVMLQGQMNHKDTMGYNEEVSADWVQIMSAGTGLRHEEYNIGNDEVHFLQICIEPKLQNIAPRYQKRYFPLEKRIDKLVTIVSSEEGMGHCWINQNAKISLGYFTAQQKVEYLLNPDNKCVYLFLLEGQVVVDGCVLNRRDAIGIWETGVVTIECMTNPCSFVLIEVPVN